jgi:hypothetical protein
VKEIIAERDLIGINSGGSRFTLMLKIGKPYAVDSEEWVCPAGVIGLYTKLQDIRGIDSFQALLQAIKYLRKLLDYFIEDGGSILSVKDETPVEISDIFN